MYIENSSLGAMLAKFDCQLGSSWRHLGHLGANIGSKRPPNGVPQAVQIASGDILAPRERLRAQPPKNGNHFPAKCAKIIVKKRLL